MLKLRRIVISLLVLLLLSAGILLGVKLSGWIGVNSAPRLTSTPALLQQVQTLSQLVTVKYIIEKPEMWDDPPQPVLSLFGAGDNHILLLAHGVVKAGVDLSRLKPNDLVVRDKTIWIELPPAQITDAYLDDRQTKVVERSTGFLRAFDKDLEQNIRQVAVQDIRSAAWHGGILTDAEQRARVQLTSFFKELGFEKVEFVPAGATASFELHSGDR